MDNKLPLAHNYYISLRYFDKLKEIESLTLEEVQRISEDTAIIYRSVQTLKKNRISLRRAILPKDYVDNFISIKFHSPWNQDHFGPVKVPPEFFFVLGDNRSYSQDSRYIGFIHKTDIAAIVFTKK